MAGGVGTGATDAVDGTGAAAAAGLVSVTVPLTDDAGAAYKDCPSAIPPLGVGSVLSPAAAMTVIVAGV